MEQGFDDDERGGGHWGEDSAGIATLDSPSPSGEGLGWGSLGVVGRPVGKCFQLLQDRLKHAFDIVPHLGICEAERGDAGAEDEDVARFVAVGAVSVSVEFDDQAFGRAEAVGNIGGELVLAAEFVVVELAVREVAWSMVPLPLSGGEIMARPSPTGYAAAFSSTSNPISAPSFSRRSLRWTTMSIRPWSR